MRRPQGRRHRAAGEQAPIAGGVGQGDDLLLGGEADAVLADDAAAAGDGKADRPVGPWARDAVAGADANIGEVHLPAARGCLAQHQGRAGRGVHLAPVVRFEDLDIPVPGLKGPRRLLHQADQEVDSQREIARPDDRDAPRRFLQLLQVFGR